MTLPSSMSESKRHGLSGAGSQAFGRLIAERSQHLLQHGCIERRSTRLTETASRLRQLEVSTERFRQLQPREGKRGLGHGAAECGCLRVATDPVFLETVEDHEC